MRIKTQFILQQVVDEYLLVPIGSEAERLHGVITLNSTGAFLWEKLAGGVSEKEELVDLLMSDYNIDANTANADVQSFINELSSFGCLE